LLEIGRENNQSGQIRQNKEYYANQIAKKKKLGKLSLPSHNGMCFLYLCLGKGGKRRP
jgi:hypothetical protein